MLRLLNPPFSLKPPPSAAYAFVEAIVVVRPIIPPTQLPLHLIGIYTDTIRRTICRHLRHPVVNLPQRET